MKKGNLGCFIDLMYGKGLSASSRKKGSVPVFSSAGLIDSHDEALVKGPGVIVGRKGTCGSVYWSKGDFYPIDTAYYVMPKKCHDICLRYIYYLLNVLPLRRMNTDAAVPGLNRTNALRLAVTIPSLPIQQRIASILSAYDDLIENNQRRISLLEQSAKLLYKEWFIHLRHPRHAATPTTNGIPKGWSMHGIMEHPYFKFINANIASYDGYKRYYATADVTDITITGEGIEYTHDEKPSRAQKSPCVNSVWFARMQETYKVLVFSQANRTLASECILSSGFAGFKACDSDFLPFLFFLINDVQFHKIKDKFCTGSTQRSLTNGGLASIKVPAPSENLVRAFGKAAAPYIDQILCLQAQNKNLARARDLLLPRLISGKIRV